MALIMSSGTLSGIVTSILLVLFLGVWVWAYSSRRKEQFNEAARMPLEEDIEVRK
jgi:cytochrome c oxidase cbb3-type subunit 4